MALWATNSQCDVFLSYAKKKYTGGLTKMIWLLSFKIYIKAREARERENARRTNLRTRFGNRTAGGETARSPDLRYLLGRYPVTPISLSLRQLHARLCVCAEPMDGTRAPPSEPVEAGQGGLLSDGDVVANLLRGQAVQNDVQQALAR